MVHEMFAINWMQLCSWKLFWMHCAKMKNGFCNFQHSQEGKRWKLFGTSEISLKRTLAHSSCNNFSSFCVYFRRTMAQTASGNLIVNYPNLLNTSFTFAFCVHGNYAVEKLNSLLPFRCHCWELWMQISSSLIYSSLVAKVFCSSSNPLCMLWPVAVRPFPWRTSALSMFNATEN